MPHNYKTSLFEWLNHNFCNNSILLWFYLMIFTLIDCILFALQTLLASHYCSEWILTKQAYRSLCSHTHNCSSVESVQLQLGIPTELAGMLPMLQHKPGSLSHYITNRRPIELVGYIATVFPNPAKTSTQKHMKRTVWSQWSIKRDCCIMYLCY